MMLTTKPAVAQTLSLAVSSPIPGTTFERGETATLTAALADGGNPVSGATVTANSPTGATITLSGTVAGTYSASYVISPTDPVGAWMIAISASSGGQIASAQLSVTISNSLVVTFTSPPALTTFNIGEAAIIKSTVTYQDGTAVPPSASVTFTNPAGTASAMSLDATDPSGKTWTTAHTITSADVPTQGFDWPITVSANVGGDSGTATRHVTLFSSLLVGVSTYSTNAYTTPDVAFASGQTAFVKATVSLHDGTVVSSGVVSFEITGTSVAATPVTMAFSSSLGAWTGSYTILATDAQGTQTVSASAADGLGNTGSGTQGIAIQTSSQGLAISISSPAPGSVINRGETATIAATLTLAGAPVSAAIVTANSPSGSAITLTNTAGGTYSGTYTIASGDPAATWRMMVIATQNGQSAVSQESLTVSSALKVAVSTFDSQSFSVPRSSFNAGQTMYVEAQVGLQDGTAVKAGSVSFELTGSSIASAPVTLTFNPSLNAWTGSYTVLQSDQTGNQVLTVTASDSLGNTGSGTETVGVNAPVSTASQGLEAAITFNPSNHDIVVNALCGTGCVAPTSVTMSTSTQGHGQGQDEKGHGHGHGDHGNGKSQRVYAISDSAGHTLTLTVSVNDDGHQVKADVLGIKYGSGPTIHPRHDSLDFQYSLAKDGSINTLEQTAHAIGTMGHAHYSAAKGNTIITIESGEDDGSQVSVTMSGLWLLELTTSSGALTVGYVSA